MTIIDFPANPLVGATHAVGAVVWSWDGVHWISAYLSGSGGGASSGMLTITGTATLPAGYTGFVRVENAGTSPISVFLPPSPSERQEIEIADTIGNAGTYPITVDGVGQMIGDAATIVISFDYGWVNLIYTGSRWVQH